MAKKAASAQILEQWTERDLTAAAERNQLAPAFEVDDQIATASDILLSGRNLLIAGESGVGKTALIHELVRRVAEGQGPDILAGRRILQFSFRRRVASLKQSTMLLPETQHLIDVLCEAGGKIVPFFRDFHVASSFDLEAQLQVLGYRLNGPVIGEGEPAALSSLFESFPDLEQQYVTYTLEEPDLDRALRILEAWSSHYAGRTGQSFSADALEEALHLSHRFLARSQLPRKALDLLNHVAGINRNNIEIGRNEVIERFSKAHHVPRTLVDPAQSLDVSGLHDSLARELLGQTEAVDAVARTIGLIKSGLSDTRRPFGVFLFAGPTGVGKTHAAQLLAQHLFGRRDRMIRLNMADYQSDRAPDVLFGDPGEYRIPLRRGVVTQRVAGQPFAVLLLDEFEKAHEKVADRFLQLFDEGSFINGNGETVACRSMIIIATSNIGAELYRDKPVGFFSTADFAHLSHELDRRMANRFRIEFLNRFDQVVHFRPLSRAEVRMIAARELAFLKDRIGFKRSGLDLDVDEAVLDWLAVNGYDPRFGARFLRRTLERDVTSALAELLVRGPVAPGTRALLTVRRNRIEARLIVPERMSKRRAAVALPAGKTVETRMLPITELKRKAEELLKAAAGPKAELETRRIEARTLLERMNTRDFWDDRSESRDVLERYRTADVMIQVEQRYEAMLHDLEKAVAEVSSQKDVQQLARAVERAAAGLREWNDRLIEETSGEIWLLIERSDPLQNAHEWLIELAQMEMAWCERVHLQSQIVAYESMDGHLTRIFLLIEGPGASSYLAAEAGIHRHIQKTGPDLKGRIQIIPRHANERPLHAPIAGFRERPGILGTRICCSTHLEVANRGWVIELVGTDAAILQDLIGDLDAYFRRPSDSDSFVSRIYGKDGVGARDPRTGAIVLRLRDAMRGDLHTLFEAWRIAAASPNRSLPE